MVTVSRAPLCISCACASASAMAKLPCSCAPACCQQLPLPARSSSPLLLVSGRNAFAAGPGRHPFSSRKMLDRDRPGCPGAFRERSNTPELVTASTWMVSVQHSNLLVLVEFWASWCGPCRMVDRVIDEIAQEYDGRLKCFKLDADRYPQLASDHGIERIPTVLLFMKGEKLKSIVGTMPKSVYVTAIESFLAPQKEG